MKIFDLMVNFYKPEDFVGIIINSTDDQLKNIAIAANKKLEDHLSEYNKRILELEIKIKKNMEEFGISRFLAEKITK